MIAFTILGEPSSKANSRQIVKFGDRSAIIKSKKARDYERTAALQIPQHARQMLTGPVFVTLRIFYASERPDLDESVVLDVLQAKFGPVVKDQPRELIRAGVYVNDRQVRKKLVEHFIDRSNPRAEITVEPMQPQQAALVAPAVPRETSKSKRVTAQRDDFADIPLG